MEQKNSSHFVVQKSSLVVQFATRTTATPSAPYSATYTYSPSFEATTPVGLDATLRATNVRHGATGHNKTYKQRAQGCCGGPQHVPPTNKWPISHTHQCSHEHMMILYVRINDTYFSHEHMMLLYVRTASSCMMWTRVNPCGILTLDVCEHSEHGEAEAEGWLWLAPICKRKRTVFLDSVVVIH